MARDRIYTSLQYKTVIDSLKENDVLGLNIVDNKDVFMLAVALGLSSPKALGKKKDLFLNTALKTRDKALFASVLLGDLPAGADIDAYANFDASADLCERCAESGYQILQKKYNDAGCDEELFEKELIKDLELLYLKNVEDDI